MRQAGMKIVGIIGGMGPLATVDLYRKIIELTPATSDQEHLHVIIDANPAIPDRTAALLYGGPDPVPAIVESARRLEQAGADVLVMPCHTAHAFLPAITDAVAIPLISMVDETVAAVRLVAPGEPVGILATEGTIAVGLYQHALGAIGRATRTPPVDVQQRVTAVIAAVKAGRITPAIQTAVITAASELVRQGAGVIVAACTELPLVLSQEHLGVPFIDPTRALAAAAVRVAREADAGEPAETRVGVRGVEP